MDTWVWVVLIVVIVLVVAALVWALARRQRTTQLQERFGPEYERTVRETGSQREAEAELAERKERREKLDIRPLEPATRDQYAAEWRAVQAQFVDEPVNAVAKADRLVTEVMSKRGYPMDDFDRQAELISVDHPHVVQEYREGHAIYRAYDAGDASTEDLRQAMVHYRALFSRLLGTDGATEDQEGSDRIQEVH